MAGQSGDERSSAPPGLGQRLPGKLHQQCVYLDYNGTTPVFPEVVAAMLPFLTEHCGNPSSPHAFGRLTRDAVAEARRQVALFINCEPEEVYFTSCGTESDNWALASAVACAAATSELAAALGGEGPLPELPHVVASAVEHPAVLEYLTAQAKVGALTFTLAPVGADGRVSVEGVLACVQQSTCCVTLMHSNNETGALQPVAEVSAALRAAAREGMPVLFHTDAAQSCGKVDVDVRQLGVDYLTLVGHKLGAPKGVAALFCRKGAPLPRLLHGGGQEGGRRGGTESVASLVALGAACELARREGEATRAHCARLRDALQLRLTEAFEGEDGRGVRVHGPLEPHLRLPNTLSIGLRRVCAAKLLVAVGDQLAASAGAACHTTEPDAPPVISSVLQAMGVPVEYGMGTLRLSVGRHTTEEDCERAVAVLVATAPRFRLSMVNSVKSFLWRLI